MTNAHDSTLPGQKTTHYTPSYGDLHFSWFFCKVFFNERFMGVGRRQVEIHGKSKVQTFAIVACYNNYWTNRLYPACIHVLGLIFTEEPYHTFLLASTIKLQVNVSTYYLARFIRTLTWYHNETEVQPSGRVSVLKNGRKIIIRDATYTDAGKYRVEIALFFVSSRCNSLWLPVLRNHAAHAPVTFTIIKLINESSSTSCK